MVFALQPSLARRQLNGKKEDIKGEFTNEEMVEYVQSLYVHGVAPLVENIVHALILRCQLGNKEYG